MPAWRWARPEHGALKRSRVRHPVMCPVRFKTHSNWQLGACPRGRSPASLVFKSKKILTYLYICL